MLDSTFDEYFYCASCFWGNLVGDLVILETEVGLHYL